MYMSMISLILIQEITNNDQIQIVEIYLPEELFLLKLTLDLVQDWWPGNTLDDVIDLDENPDPYVPDTNWYVTAYEWG